MSQVSLPMRIALLATLAFSAVWLVALRPKSVPPSATPPVTPAESAPGKAAEQAGQATEAANDSAAKHEAAADGASGEAGTAKPAAPSATDKGTAKPNAIDVDAIGKVDSKDAKAVIADIKAGKVVVLLFWDRKVYDDRAVRAAVDSLSSRNGKVAKHVAPVADLADYEPITRGVPVVTSPTVLIIDRARRARSVAGLTTRGELNELIDRALKVKP